MDSTFESSVKDIVWVLRRIVGLINLDSKRMMKRFGVTGPQGVVIKSLHTLLEPQSSAALSRHLNMTPSNMTGIVDRLEERGLVRRTQKLGDRRTHLIELTDKGQEFSRTLPDPMEEKLMSGLADLQPTEVFGVYSALSTIADIIGAEYVARIPVDEV